MEICKIFIPEPLEYIEFVGKRINPKTGKVKTTRHYLTGNLFFASMNHFVQKEIVEKTKWFLHNYMKDIPVITQFPIHIELTYHSEKNTTFDLDNKCYYWNKLICDKLVKDGKIPDDDIKHIAKITWNFKRETSALTIVINTLS